MSLVIALAGLRGLRRGEIRGLLWADVDLKRKLIYLRKQLCGNCKDRDLLKTPASARFLKLPDYMVSLLQQMLDLQSKARLIYGEDKFKSGYVLAHTSYKRFIGQPYSANFYSENFLKLLKRKGMQRMRLHDLRHSFGSNLLYQGIPIPTVSKMMGHASVAITLETYAHEIEELMAMNEETINLEIEETLSNVRSASANSEYHQLSPSITGF